MAHVLNTTPTAKAFEAMSKFVEAAVGEEPSKLDRGPGAQKLREARTSAFNFLHRMYALAMRHGHAEAYNEMIRAQQMRETKRRIQSGGRMKLDA